MAKSFIITTPHYLRQAGQLEPQYVAASAECPVTVTLDDDQVPGHTCQVDDKGVEKAGTRKNMKCWYPVDQPPPKPKPAHGESKGGAPKSHEVMGKVQTGGRAADK